MKLNRAVEVLSKRMDWLASRIANSQKDLTYDKEELAALTRAVDLMKEAMGYGDE